MVLISRNAIYIASLSIFLPFVAVVRVTHNGKEVEREE